MNVLVDRFQLSNDRMLLVSLIISIALVFLLCFFFEPTWESNDDVGMSMVAHGYGLVPIGSPKLFFSNVLWGYLVRAIPEINGVLGYSIVTLGVLIMVGAVIIDGLYRLGANHVTCLSIFALILVRPVLFPQFTVNAGLLMIGAIICWHIYTQQNDRRMLLVGCFLAFCSFLIRSQEFFLVFIVALPVFSWRALFLSRFAKIVFLVLFMSIAISAVIDYQAYQTADWKFFNELKPAISPIVDFGAGVYLNQHPDILQRYGYSSNDIDLIANWFFVDSTIANPKRLLAMLVEIGDLPEQSNALTKAWLGVQALWHQKLLPITVVALLLFLLRPSWQVMGSWVLVIASVFVLGLLGRPAVLRVYVPLVCLLLIAPFLRNKISTWRKHLGAFALFVAAIINIFPVFSESKTLQIMTAQTRKDLAGFSNDVVFIWADSFPFEVIYPVLGTSYSAMSYKFYSLGGLTWAPVTRSFIEQQRGRGMIDLLVKETGVPIIAHVQLFKYLEIYCKEHFQGQLYFKR